jgi:uncharacterized protein
VTLEIAHDLAQHRFATTVDGEYCQLEYELDRDTMTITHVLVPDAVSRRGIAAALMQSALETARAQGWRVIPQCPYAAYYFEKFPQWSGLLARR